MKALSIRPPWWWFIFHHGKDIENRDWHPWRQDLRYRGPAYIHASKWWRLGEIMEDVETGLAMAESAGASAEVTKHDLEQMSQFAGHIVGRCEIVDVVRASASPWFVGPFGLVLRNPEVIRAWPCRGALGFFDPLITDDPTPPKSQPRQFDFDLGDQDT